MGCTAIETSVSTEMLKTQLKKLKYSLGIQKARLDKEILKGEQILCKQFLKPFRERSKKLERAMILGNARYSNQKNIYGIIQNQTYILIQHVNLLDQQKELEQIQEPLNILRYSSIFMGCEDLYRFQAMLKEVYPRLPFPSDQSINIELLKSQKKQKVAFKQELEYLFHVSTQYSIPMEKINQAGHGYRYGAESYQR